MKKPTELCWSCGKTYEEHMEKYPDGFIIKCPCGMLKKHFSPTNSDPWLIFGTSISTEEIHVGQACICYLNKRTGEIRISLARS